MSTAAQNWSNETGNRNDEHYNAFLERVKARFIASVGNGPLFTTDAGDLWPLYLDTFEGADRQHHNCTACRHFIQRFGNLVTINEFGETVPAIWNSDDANSDYKLAVGEMERRVQRANVTGVFYSSDRVWGQPKTGQWRHLAVTPPKALVYSERLLTASQAMADKLHDYQTLAFALDTYSVEQLSVALEVLASDVLYRSEKVIGVATWLLAVKRAVVNQPNKQRRSAGIWLSVATEPAGYCHPRSSMIGTLLDDIAAGHSLQVVKEKFAAKMHPLRYQRPQAAPKLGNLVAAEKIVEKLGIAASLRRRFARLEDIITLWTHAETEAARQPNLRVFAHISEPVAAKRPMVVSQLPPTKMTWVKFATTVLPDALSIDAWVPRNGNFVGLVTAVDPDAPPILQWDYEEKRYPVSWYVYTGGSSATQWNLNGGMYRKVNALALNPAHANRRNPGTRPSLVAILDGARDLTGPQSLALFPETLKSELHEIRSTIEAYSKAGRLEGVEQASACGLVGPEITLRVKTRAMDRYVKIDRWD